MDDTEAELRGRIVMQESLLAAMLTQLAERTPDPAATIGAIMANAEDLITAAGRAAAGADTHAAQYAQSAFGEFSDAIEQHLARRSKTTSRP
jgi:hypothetical protein